MKRAPIAVIASAALAAMLFGFGASAQTKDAPPPEKDAAPVGKDAEMAADKMSSASERALLLRTAHVVNKSHMPEEAMASLKRGVEQSRFDARDFAWDSQDVLAWCQEKAAEAQQKAGDVDGKGQGVVTLDAVQRRCEQLASYGIEGEHSCIQQSSGFVCSVIVKATVTMYRSVVRDGKVAIELGWVA